MQNQGQVWDKSNQCRQDQQCHKGLCHFDAELIDVDMSTELPVTCMQIMKGCSHL